LGGESVVIEVVESGKTTTLLLERRRPLRCWICLIVGAFDGVFEPLLLLLCCEACNEFALEKMIKIIN